MSSTIFTADDLIQKFGLSKSDILRLVSERRVPGPRKVFGWHLADIKKWEEKVDE